MEQPARRSLRNWIPAAVGFLAAFVAINWLRPGPPPGRTLQAVLFIYALAVAEVLFIVGVSAAAAWFAWYVMRRRRLPA